jgi:hypothetical protein
MASFVNRVAIVALVAIGLVGSLNAVARGADNVPPPGWVALFNGKNLDGWKGLVEDPIKRAKMSPAELAKAQKKQDDVMRRHWFVEDGVLVFKPGKKERHMSLCTVKDYGNFELQVDWKINPHSDSGIYLRGTPQVQIWDYRFRGGSGGLFNNQKEENANKPSMIADKYVGEWNHFDIKIIGDQVTVKLNGETVVDNVQMENYWDRSQPLFAKGQIELQDHGDELYFKNIYIKELPDDLKAPPANKIKPKKKK